VSDANVKVEGNAGASKTNGSATGESAMPLFAIPGLFRGFAEQGADRAKEHCQKLQAASGEIAEVVREAYSGGTKAAADYGAKIIEISTDNTNSALDYITTLMDTRSLSEALNLWAAQSRKNLEVASAQNRELLKLARKVATESAEPVKKSVAKVLQTTL